MSKYKDKETQRAEKYMRVSELSDDMLKWITRNEEEWKKYLTCAARIYKYHIGISFNRFIDETIQQYDLFTDPEQLEKERDVQKAMIEIKSRFGKNAVLKGMNLLDAGTTRERNAQIGGHKA